MFYLFDFDILGKKSTAADTGNTSGTQSSAAQKGKGIAVDDGSKKKKSQPRKKVIKLG